MQIGETIKRLRFEKGMTQAYLAEVLDISPAAVSKWEKGHSYPDIMHLIPLSSILGVSVDELLEDKSTPPNEMIEELSYTIKELIDSNHFDEAFKLSKEIINDNKGNLELSYVLFVLLLTSQHGIQSSKADEVIRIFNRLLFCANKSISSATATTMLRYYLSIKQFDRVDELFAYIPSESLDYMKLKAEVFEVRGEYASAYKTYEEITYSSFMNVDNAIVGLERLAKIEGNIESQKYYREKRLKVIKLFEMSEYMYYSAQLDTDHVFTLSDINFLLELVPTMNSFTNSKLYSHMNFHSAGSNHIESSIYQSIIDLLIDEESLPTISKSERLQLIERIKGKLS